jgi:SAM-dependent methyltransferase
LNQWSSGYINDIDYTFGYYTELNPRRAELSFLTQGLSFPKVKTACELGFGNGLSLLMHDASSDIRWYGTDFNPSQAAFARDMAEKSGLSCEISCSSFAEFCRRDDLPQFDYIALHGIWSWVSKRDRETIIEFLRDRLNIGGVAYISYNTYPGWSTFAPIRSLMAEHYQKLGAIAEGSPKRIKNALNYVQALLDADPVYLQHAPLIKTNFKSVIENTQEYLAHEYFNKEWNPVYFSEISAELDEAKLTFACSADFRELTDTTTLKSAQKKFLDTIDDRNMRESARDFMMSTHFRRDYWVKGYQPLTKAEQIEKLHDLSFTLMREKDSVKLELKGPLGTSSLLKEVYEPALLALSSSDSVSFSQLNNALTNSGLSVEHTLQVVQVLAAKGDILAVVDENESLKFKSTCDSLNDRILHRAKTREDLRFLASPKTGGGVVSSRVNQLYALALMQGHKTEKDWAIFALQCLKMAGQKLVVGEATIDSEKEAMSYLSDQAKSFKELKLPTLRRLGVI